MEIPELLPPSNSSYSPFQFVSRPEFDPDAFIKLAAGSIEGAQSGDGRNAGQTHYVGMTGGSGGGGGSSFASYG